MIELRTPNQIEQMRPAGRFVADVITALSEKADVGVNLLELDERQQEVDLAEQLVEVSAALVSARTEAQVRLAAREGLARLVSRLPTHAEFLAAHCAAAAPEPVARSA